MGSLKDLQSRCGGVARVAVALGVAACLFCCSSPSGETTRPASAVHRGGSLRTVQEAPASLDPLACDSVYESLPINQIFDTLVTFDRSLHLVPALAETWTISRDGTVYTFTIRERVVFHDGRPLTADDVAYTLSRALRPEGGVPSLAFSYLLAIEGAEAYADRRASEISGLTTSNPRTVEIRLASPYTSFLEVLSMDNLGVVSREAVERLGAERFGREPIGSGPFSLTDWREDGLRLDANPDFWGVSPKLATVEIHFLGDDEADFGAARFFDGRIDVLEPPTESISRLVRESDVHLHRYHELSLSFLGLNSAKPPLDQLWMRRAIAHALNRKALVAHSPSVRREAVGILPPGISGYSPEYKAIEYDPDEARRILAEAGHPEGRGLPPVTLYNPSQGIAASKVLERIRVDLDAVGIGLRVVPVTWGEMSERLENDTAEAFLLAWLADLTDPDAFLRSMFESGGSANYFGHCDPETDRLLVRGAEELNPRERSRIYRELERQILKQAPLVPLYHTVGIVATRKRVRGLEPGPLGLAKVELERVWLTDGKGGATSTTSVD